MDLNVGLLISGSHTYTHWPMHTNKKTAQINNGEEIVAISWEFENYSMNDHQFKIGDFFFSSTENYLFTFFFLG